MERQAEKNLDAGTPPTRDVALKVDSCADRSQQRDNSGTECCSCNRRFGAEHAHPCSLQNCACKGKGLIHGLGGCTRWMVAERRAAVESKAALESRAAFESDTSSGDDGLVIADDPTPVPGADVPSRVMEDSGSVCSFTPLQAQAVLQDRSPCNRRVHHDLLLPCDRDTDAAEGPVAASQGMAERSHGSDGIDLFLTDDDGRPRTDATDEQRGSSAR